MRKKESCKLTKDKSLWLVRKDVEKSFAFSLFRFLQDRVGLLEIQPRIFRDFQSRNNLKEATRYDTDLLERCRNIFEILSSLSLKMDS